MKKSTVYATKRRVHDMHFLRGVMEVDRGNGVQHRQEGNGLAPLSSRCERGSTAANVSTECTAVPYNTSTNHIP